jgi:hypothetical protein
MQQYYPALENITEWAFYIFLIFWKIIAFYLVYSGKSLFSSF